MTKSRVRKVQKQVPAGPLDDLLEGGADMLKPYKSDVIALNRVR